MEKDQVVSSVGHNNKCHSCLSITNLCQETQEKKKELTMVKKTASMMNKALK